MQRPHIICHMITSLDGRLLPDRWSWAEGALMDLYEGVAARLGADGWIVGRTTMESFVPSGPSATGGPAEPREDVIAAPAAKGLAICFDRQGRLRPESSEIEGDHLVLVMSTAATEDHVQMLSDRGVSVIFAGTEGDDIDGALARIGRAFGARRLLLEGGGRINGAFLAADRIDETSTLVLPVIDGQRDIPAIYDDPGATPARHLSTIAVETLEHGVVWLRHLVART